MFSSVAWSQTTTLLDPQLFPRSKAIDVQVYFWKKIFTEVSSKEALLHDKVLVLPIFEKVSVEGLSRKQAKKKIAKRKKLVKHSLNSLANALETKRRLTASQQKLLKKYYVGVSPKELRRSAQRIRVQNGVSDRFRDGIVRSGIYMPHILKTLKEYGLPSELAHLPHVESSFYYGSHSKTGAKGIWQFTRGTGKQYMHVNSRVDERIDPFLSTVAAAKLLKSNYKLLKSWPLAITGYNHGPNGVNKITKKVGSRDLGYIIRHYNSRTFNFASKNFYAEFIAAVEVASDYETHFGPLEIAKPLKYQEVHLPKNMSLPKVISKLKVSREELLALNPAFTPAVIRGTRWIPTYYKVKVPVTPLSERHLAQNEDFHKSIKVSSRSTRNNANLKQVVVKRGDSLSAIAERHRMSTRKLAALNHLSVRSTIHPGQRLHVMAASPQTYVVKRGDNLTSIARKQKISVKQLVAINGLKSKEKIFPGQQLKLVNAEHSKPRSQKVVVKRGDTLTAIAQRNGIRVEKLLSANGLSQNSIIYPGQRLIINF